MAASKKSKRGDNISDEYGDSSDSEGSESMDEDVPDTVINVDFEARTPDDRDFHGIKQLLQQLFLKAHINLSELTDLIIHQNFICSVIKQSLPLEASAATDEEEDDDDDFGMITVVNISKKDKECIKQICSLLHDHCIKNCSGDAVQKFSSVLNDPLNSVGLILCERFINIPAQISLPLYESLSSDIKKTKESKKQFDFNYYILISKIFKPYEQKGNVKSKMESVIYSNAEEELFLEEAELYFDYSVGKDIDSALGGQWSEKGDELSPYRRVMIFPAAKVDFLVKKLKTEFAPPHQKM